MDDQTYARLFYLVWELKVTLPRVLWPLIPGGHWLREVKSLVDPAGGRSAAEARRLYVLGASLGTPSLEELRHLLVSILEKQSPRLSGAQWLEIGPALSSLSDGRTSLLSGEVIQSMDSITEVPAYPRYSSGLLPVDSVLGGGLSSGIYLFIGAPSAGKSSLMMMLAEALALSHPESSLVYLQTEMPEGAFKSRMRPIFQRTQFKSSDTLICGLWSPSRLVEFLEEKPDPNRIVIYDSPDPILLSGETSNIRSSISQAWLNFIRIKQELAKTVIVTSWSRRGESTSLRLESGAEGAAKERFSDAVVGIMPDGHNSVLLECFKNRMGIPGTRYSFEVDWANLRVTS